MTRERGGERVKSETVGVMVALPRSLHRRLVRRARELGRSMAAHVRWLIGRDVDRPRKGAVKHGQG